MSYSCAFGAMLPGLPLLPEAAYPVVEKKGLFWISDAVRNEIATYIGTKTDFAVGNLEDSNAYGKAFPSAAPHANWVAAEAAKGRAVLISPAATSAAPSVRVVTSGHGFDLAWDAARSFSGNFAILAAPAKLVADAEAEAAAKPLAESRTAPSATYGDEPSKAPSSSSVPKWMLPAVIGIGAVALIALFK